jgi:hypothetical protein
VRRPTRVLTLAAVAALSTLALAACTQPSELPGLPTTSASPTPTPTPTEEPGLALPAIADLALRAEGDGTVVSVHDEAAGTAWEVRIVLDDGSVREVHLAPDGTLLAGPTGDATDADEESANRALVAAAALDLEAAERRMLAAVEGGRATAVGLDDFQDRVVWRGDVLDADGVRHDVRIDAVNGSVLLNRADAPPTPATGS